MPTTRPWICSLLGAVLIVAPIQADEGASIDAKTVRPESGRKALPDSRPVGEWRDVLLPDGQAAGRMAPLPANVEVRRLEVGGSGAAPRGDITTEIYRNTNRLDPQPGEYQGEVFARGAFLRVADDLVTAAVEPCPLSEVVVQVHGGNFDTEGTPGLFNVNLGVWTGCPGDGGALMTNGVVSIPGLEDNVVWDLSIVLPNQPTPPSTTIWVSGGFSTHTAGFIVGTPPIIGFSRDAYDDPVLACSAKFGSGFPQYPHASFAAQVFAEGACETHFLAYAAINESAGSFDRGAGVRLADDLQLIVPVCELSTYEIAIRGQSSNYQVATDLRIGDTLSGPLSVIPGTERVFLGAPGDVEIFRASFPPEIFLREDEGVWLTWQVNRVNTGALVAGDAQVGSSTDFYAREDPTFGWQWELFPGSEQGIFHIAINCRGEAVLGACCRAVDDEPSNNVCVDQVPATDCLFARWLPNTSPAELTLCANDPFDPPCGGAACCFESTTGETECEDLSGSACDARNDCVGPSCIGLGGVWEPGDYCGKDGQECASFFACHYAENECGQINDELVCLQDSDCPEPYLGCLPIGVCELPKGCNNLTCCDRVCALDPVCCDGSDTAGWDEYCALRARESCSLYPANNACGQAQAITLAPVGGRFIGEADVFNMDLASESQLDPGFCCKLTGTDEKGHGTLWYSFEAPGPTARITTCDSTPGPDQNSILQVFRPSHPATLESACTTLGQALACNDDSGCGASGRLSDFCLTGLTPGELLIVMLAAPTNAGVFGNYTLTIESPCPTLDEQPVYPTCETALGPILGPGGGVEDEIPFDCSGDDINLCLENASLQCPAEPALEAMNNDVWMDYTTGCTGTLRVTTCETSGPSPDTTLAVYGPDPSSGSACPAEGGLLLGANDDAPVSAYEAQFVEQQCSLDTDACFTDHDCSLPGSRCLGRACVLACSTDLNCRVDGEWIGVCVDRVCRRPCETDDDCPLKACSVSGGLCDDDSDCTAGICSWAGNACDVDEGCSRVCRWQPNIHCTIGGGECSQGDVCIAQICIRIEHCQKETCESACWPGSSVTVPVAASETYTVRLGGENGSEPVGTLRLTCTPSDCDFNEIPDACDISCEAMGGTCGLFAGCGTAADCQPNGVPDLCDLLESSTDDDGNGVPDECETVECGDGVVDEGEECDDGGASADCDADCTLAVCGDGGRNPSARESCDGADALDCFTRLCRPDCTCQLPDVTVVEAVREDAKKPRDQSR